MAEERRYALVDETGLVANIIVWDGETTYDPGSGWMIVEAPDQVGPGWRRLGDGSFAAPDSSD